MGPKPNSFWPIALKKQTSTFLFQIAVQISRSYKPNYLWVTGESLKFFPR